KLGVVGDSRDCPVRDSRNSASSCVSAARIARANDLRLARAQSGRNSWADTEYGACGEMPGHSRASGSLLFKRSSRLARISPALSGKKERASSNTTFRSLVLLNASQLTPLAEMSPISV